MWLFQLDQNIKEINYLCKYQKKSQLQKKFGSSKNNNYKFDVIRLLNHTHFLKLNK